jgi:predicted AAA+ superfamily ATPase
LIILDEIQESPAALTDLKYFQEEAPQYFVVAAGSLLGLAIHEGTSFLVGKVDLIDLYPMTFVEFLEAIGEQPLADLLTEPKTKLFGIFHEKLISLLKSYFVVGGMPEAVAGYQSERDMTRVRTIQERIVREYELDFSKHAPDSEIPRIRDVWRSIPIQLAKDNRKFVYAQVHSGARARSHELALLWLSDAGLANRVTRITAPRTPLRAYIDTNSFKLFIHDVGILGALSGLEPSAVLESDSLFTEFKGALTEQFVCQELLAGGLEPHYWTNEGAKAEVDFVVQIGAQIVPVEVKAGTNLKAQSLRVYREKFSPELSLRVSLAGYEQQPGLLNLPLYAANLIPTAASQPNTQGTAG